MRRPLRLALSLAATLLSAALLLSACGGGSSGPPASTVQIYSAWSTDGEVHRIDWRDGSYSFDITPDLDRGQTLWVGSQEGQIAGTYDDYLAVLDFDLAPIPLTAAVERATLLLSVASVEPSVAVRAELIDLGVNGSSVPYTMYNFPIAGGGNRALDLWDNSVTTAVLPTLEQAERSVTAPGPLSLDVTRLMDEAQFLGLPRFQVRLRHANEAIVSKAVLNDPLALDAATTPRLDVTYR